MKKTKRKKILAAIIILIATSIGMYVTSFVYGLTIWKFSDGTTEKTLNITTSPGSNSDAKITVPVGATVENIRMKVKQKVFSTKYIWIPLSSYNSGGNDKVAQINVSDGSLVKLWDTGNNPSRLAVSPDGNEVWIANRSSANVTKIDVSAGTSTNYSVMTGPRGITFDNDGNVWVGGYKTAMKLDRNGNILLTLDASSPNPYLIITTYGADTDADGYVWFVSRDTDGRVVRIDPNNCNATSCSIDNYFTNSAQNYGVGIDSKGNVWIGGSWAHKIFYLEGSRSSHVGTVHSISFSTEIPRGIAIDSHDNVWFADWHGNQIIKYNPITKTKTPYQDPNAVGPLGISISIEETPPNSGNFEEYVWAVNYSSHNLTKLRISDGTIVGTYCADGNNPAAPSWTTGKYGSGLRFDRRGYIDIGSGTGLDLGTVGTLEAWFRTSSSEQQSIVGKGGGWNKAGYYLTTINGNHLRLHWNSNGNEQIVDTATTFTYGAWTHVVAQSDGTNLWIYINGVKDTNTNTNIQNTDNSYAVGIGRANWNNNRLPLVGDIDEVRIYNRAISPTEVTDHYHNIFTNNTGLVAYWNFDEGSGTVVHDSSTNGNDGTLRSTCSIAFPYNYSNMTGFRGPITTLDIGNDGTKEWGIASYISETELNSTYVASVLTSLASTCTCPGCSLSAGNECTIDFTFSSTNKGVIELSSLSATAPSWFGWGDIPPPSEAAKGTPSDFEKAVMSIINAILGFATMIAVLAMIYTAGLSLAAGVTHDPKAGLLTKKMLAYTLIGLTIMGIGYAIVRAVITAVIK